MVSKWQYQEKKYVLSNQFHCLEKFLAKSQILKGLKNILWTNRMPLLYFMLYVNPGNCAG